MSGQFLRRRRRKNAIDANVPRLERLVEEIQAERRLRLDVLALEPMVPRGFKRRPRPKTAIISDAAKVAIEVSEWLENANTQTTISEVNP